MIHICSSQLVWVTFCWDTCNPQWSEEQRSIHEWQWLSGIGGMPASCVIWQWFIMPHVFDQEARNTFNIQAHLCRHREKCRIKRTDEGERVSLGFEPCQSCTGACSQGTPQVRACVWGTAPPGVSIAAEAPGQESCCQRRSLEGTPPSVQTFVHLTNRRYGAVSVAGRPTFCCAVHCWLFRPFPEWWWSILISPRRLEQM